MVKGDTLLPHSASVMSSTRRTDTPARYISMRASAAMPLNDCGLKEMPLSLGTLRITSPEVVVRLRL